MDLRRGEYMDLHGALMIYESSEWGKCTDHMSN